MTTHGELTADQLEGLGKEFAVDPKNRLLQNALTRNEVERLISNGVFVAEYPLGEGTRARFVRTQVLAAARRWESATRTIPK